VRRLETLKEAGAVEVTIFSVGASHALRERAGERLIERWPNSVDLDRSAAVFITDLTIAEAEPLVAQARALRKLVNTEDVPHLCDFHVPAIVRRGDLILAVSTRGLAPALARRIKQYLARRFGPEWAARVASIGRERASWRGDGADSAIVRRRTDRLIDEGGWL
jgi:precorrin-2 dehydrogenase/sirohydrochlorin ferrochelatase